MHATRYSLIGLAFVGMWLGVPATGQADELDDLIKKVTTWDYGQDAKPWERISEIVVESQKNTKKRKAIAAKLAKLLQGDATLATKRLVCKELWRIGDRDVVPTIAPLLEKAETSDMARYALERMNDAAAGAALRKALDKTGGDVRVGIINSLGEREDRAAVEALAELAKSRDRGTAEAAIIALGKIAGNDAAGKLIAVKRGLSPALLPVMNHALLACAADYADTGNTEAASDLYKRLYALNEPSATRAAALKGLVTLRAADAVPLIVAALNRSDPIVRGAAAEAMRDLEDKAAAKSLADALDRSNARAKVLILHALGERGDAGVRQAVVKLAAAGEAEVRSAALRALGGVGDASVVGLLLNVAVAGGDQADIARASLVQLKDKKVDQTLMDMLPKAEAKSQTEIIRALAARHAEKVLPLLWETAKSGSEIVRVESFQAIGALADHKDLTPLLDLLIAEAKQRPRDAARLAVLKLAEQIDPPSRRADAAVAAFTATARKPQARRALLRIYGALQTEETRKRVCASLRSQNAGVRKTAVDVLSGWDSSKPADELVNAAANIDDAKMLDAALQAAVKVLGKPGDRPAEKTAKLYGRILELAKSTDTKKAALQGLSSVADDAAMQIAKKHAKDKSVKAEALAAMDQIRRRLYKPSASVAGDAAGKAMDGDIKTRWDTGKPQAGGEWFMVDLGATRKVIGVVMDATGSDDDYPRGYEVYVSDNPKKWDDPVAKGKGEKPKIEVKLKKPKTGRYVRIVQTGKAKSNFWSIHELAIRTAE